MTNEAGLLQSYLDIQREHVLGALEGLSDEDLRRPVLPSGWSCLGMVQHLTVGVERFWFRGMAAGDRTHVIVDDEVSDAVWRVAPDTAAAEVFEEYRREIELADKVVAAADLDAALAWWPEDMWPNWRLDNVRDLILHVITETACHAGHLDAARELIDGKQWIA